MNSQNNQYLLEFLETQNNPNQYKTACSKLLQVVLSTDLLEVDITIIEEFKERHKSYNRYVDSFLKFVFTKYESKNYEMLKYLIKN